MTAYTDLKKGFRYARHSLLAALVINGLELFLSLFPVLCAGIFLASAFTGIPVEQMVKNIIAILTR